MDAASAGCCDCFGNVFFRGGEIGGWDGGAGDGVVGDGDVAGYGHDLRHGRQGTCEGA